MSSVDQPRMSPEEYFELVKKFDALEKIVKANKSGSSKPGPDEINLGVIKSRLIKHEESSLKFHTQNIRQQR